MLSHNIQHPKVGCKRHMLMDTILAAYERVMDLATFQQQIRGCQQNDTGAINGIPKVTRRSSRRVSASWSASSFLLPISQLPSFPLRPTRLRLVMGLNHGSLRSARASRDPPTEVFVARAAHLIGCLGEDDTVSLTGWLKWRGWSAS